MKLLAFAIPFAVALALAPRAAHAGCPQAVEGGCNAVIKLEAVLGNEPACVRLDRIEPENGCVCHGTVTVVNDCTYDIVSTEPVFGTDDSLLLPGETGFLNVEGKEPGVHHEEFNLQGQGQLFKIILDYTVERRVLETGGCSVSGAERPGLAGVGLGLAALLFARRRRGR
ncbi:MXAN_0125 family MYXO-CTERM protein [Polyangium fumosum]|uniref:Uncharacterized protein n=1 Tax=Polyangium fumosum TaxID=889272 RepID=A0A4U1ICZ3_9BACT|nr:MXAN_0125 family MYXO-CTERM protein [Polyangium fumosum]TKC91478.1 hypothetical protein E8A74_50650 [Polyangium fumosum]